MEKERKGGRKGDMPCTGKSIPTGKEETEESRGRRSSVHGQATKSTARIEEKLNRRAKEESRRALQQRNTRRSTVARIGVVYPRNDSNL